MQNFKISYLSVLLIFFLSGKAHSIVSPLKATAIHTEHKKELKVIIKVSPDTGDENSPKKRKRKNRGVEVTVPKISEVTCLGFFTYKIFKAAYTESVYASFRYCVSPKRGPPLV